MSESEDSGSDCPGGRVLTVNIHDEQTAEAFKAMFEAHPDALMWHYDEYTEAERWYCPACLETWAVPDDFDPRPNTCPYCGYEELGRPDRTPSTEASDA